MGPLNANTDFDRRLTRVLLATVVALAALRVYFGATIELLPEEAYYWTYAQHPSTGYFDHPPMVAWLIKLGTLVRGDTPTGVRLGSGLLWLGSGALIFVLAQRWYDRRTALAAVLLYSLLPIYAGASVIVTPDAPLLFFWMVTLVALTFALQTGRAGWWLLAGVGFGGALLSKYTAVLLAASLFLFLLRSPAHRGWLRRPAPWLALVAGLVVFSPVIYWNATHGWASFLFQSTRTVTAHPQHLRNFALFWLMQLLVLTPPVLALFAVVAWRGVRVGWRSTDDRTNFAVAFSLPLFVLFVAASYKTQIHINWTAPAFLSLLPATAATVLAATHDGSIAQIRRWRYSAGLAVLLCAVVIVVGYSVLAWGIPSSYAHAGGWRPLSDEAARARAELTARAGRPAFLVGCDKYNIAAEIGFYTHDPADCINGFALGVHGLGYRYWADLRQFSGRPALAVLTSDSDPWMQRLRDHFARIDPPRRVEFPRPNSESRVVYFVDCYEYQGPATR